MTDFESLAEWVNREMDRPNVNQKALLTSLVKTVESKVKDAMAPYYFFMNREVCFERFTRSWKSLAWCQISNSDNLAKISVSKNIMFAGNGITITEAVFHEMLHAILPKEEYHGKFFDLGCAEVNKFYGCDVGHHANNSRIRVPNRKYQIICPECNVVLRTISRDSGLDGDVIKRPNAWHCCKCKSKVIVKPITVEFTFHKGRVVEQREIPAV